MKGSAVRSQSNQGFALPLALVALSILAMLALGVQVAGRAGSQDVAQIEVLLRRRWLVEAARARILTALETPGDPLTRDLFSEGDVPWVFEGTSVKLKLETESRKLDINAADPALIRQAVDQLLGERYQDVVSPDVLNAASRRAFASPVELLKPAKRFGLEAEILKRHLTALSGQTHALPRMSGMTDSSGSETVANFTNLTVADHAEAATRSIYRIVVTQDGDHDDPTVRGAQADLYVALNDNDPSRIAVIHAE